jgi:hypothetical protein
MTKHTHSEGPSQVILFDTSWAKKHVDRLVQHDRDRDQQANKYKARQRSFSHSIGCYLDYCGELAIKITTLRLSRDFGFRVWRARSLLLKKYLQYLQY